VDLDDADIHGGTFDRFGLGVNWWATYGWKFGLGWGYIKLYKSGTTGVTNSVQTRLQ
jgi:phosphate-selective porin OprO and OprP